jgi:hypothetical protein
MVVVNVIAECQLQSAASWTALWLRTLNRTRFVHHQDYVFREHSHPCCHFNAAIRPSTPARNQYIGSNGESERNFAYRAVRRW